MGFYSLKTTTIFGSSSILRFLKSQQLEKQTRTERQTDSRGHHHSTANPPNMKESIPNKNRWYS